MKVKIWPRQSTDRGGYVCMPLLSNVPIGKNGWELTKCPECGRSCCKMPDDGQEILVTNGETTWQDTCFIDSNGYYLDGGYDWIDITAWRPLPKPYKED